jgi:recombination associated protein RdgC
MWFKNLCIYTLRAPLPWSDEQLEQALAQSPFQPCGSQEPVRIGWVPALPDGETLAHHANGCTLLSLRRQQKILPGPAVAEALDEKVRGIERSQARQVFRKERKELKEQIVMELLPRALTRSSRSDAYIDRSNGWLLVNASSRNRAEELLSKLREDVESLPIVPLTCNANPAVVMTDWLINGSLPQPFTLGQQCELRDAQESGNTVKVRGQDLRTDEVLQHIEAGKQVTKLALHWGETLDCVLDEALIVRRLRFSDAFHERLESLDDERAQFDQTFAVMTLELGRFVGELTQLFGGVIEN